MIAAKEFRQHAAECRKMARFTHDEIDKVRWTHLADRWMVCAELAEQAEHAKPAEQKLSKSSRARSTH